MFSCGKSPFVLCVFVLMFVSVDIMFHLHSHLTRSECSKSFANWLAKQSRSTAFIRKQIHCTIGQPCEYPETVDLRIIVMSYNRDLSLLKLLQSLNLLEMDEDFAALEIWIDKGKNGKVHNNTLKVAESFVWRHGIKRVHVQEAHAGIYGQWIDTWRPKAYSPELALFLEDDLIVSPFAWRWIKAVNREYGQRPDCFGFTLQSEHVQAAVRGSSISIPQHDWAFMYQLVGSWGFVPVPSVWIKFQDWFHEASKNNSFHPYVNELVMTTWYKGFETKGTDDSMWTMWFIYFCNQFNLFGVYNNLNHVEGKKDLCLAVHRAEPGLHYAGHSRKGVEHLLLKKWDNKYVSFAKDIKKLNWKGKNFV